jgi:hypothetical protein
MAKDAPNDIVYYICIPAECKEALARIRTWSNLKIAFETTTLWIKGFDFAQLQSMEVKSIRDKMCYYEKEGKLCLINSILPERNIPAVLWSSIDRALPLKLPSFNHNYFGIHESIETKIVPSDKEYEVEAMLAHTSVLNKYIVKAPEIRLSRLKWTLLNNDKVFLMGKPILPLQGEVLWRRQNMFFPAGYDLELSVLNELIASKLNPESDQFILWSKEGSYALIPKNQFSNLSLSSFKQSIKTYALHL